MLYLKEAREFGLPKRHRCRRARRKQLIVTQACREKMRTMKEKKNGKEAVAFEAAFEGGEALVDAGGLLQAIARVERALGPLRPRLRKKTRSEEEREKEKRVCTDQIDDGQLGVAHVAPGILLHLHKR